MKKIIASIAAASIVFFGSITASPTAEADQVKNSAESRINEILKLKIATIDKTVDSDKTSNSEWHRKLIEAALKGD